MKPDISLFVYMNFIPQEIIYKFESWREHYWLYRCVHRRNHFLAL